MTGLQSRLIRRIEAEGPLTVAAFMATALYDPAEGYYRAREAIGRGGDFVTAPEVSQVFGELLGLWCAAAWESLGRPRPVRLIELGPGRGTLLADALRALALLPSLAEALQLHLVEISPRLRALQERALAGRAAQWHESLETVPEGPCLILANEFFDALPIRQFERAPEGWRERLVGLAENGRDLAFALSGLVPQALIPEALADAPLASVFEVSSPALSLAQALGRRVAGGPGAALIVDYGYEAPPLKGTLQAVRGHARQAPLETPGQADLSALVDFRALAAAAETGGARAWGPVGQGLLLERLGLAERVRRLRLRATAAQAADLAAAAERLGAPGQMGTLFKALALTPPASPALAGFGH